MNIEQATAAVTKAAEELEAVKAEYGASLAEGKASAALKSKVETVAGLMGPTYDLLERSSRVGAIGLRSLNGEFDLTGGDVGDIRRLTPFASLPYWRWFIDGMLVPDLQEAVK